MPKRECKDVFINNYNPRILQDDPSNHDIQIIAGEEGAYACAVYAAKYLSKDEEVQSKLLRTIEQESLKFGDCKNLGRFLKIQEKFQCRKSYLDCLAMLCVNQEK